MASDLELQSRHLGKDNQKFKSSQRVSYIIACKEQNPKIKKKTCIVLVFNIIISLRVMIVKKLDYIYM